jgi:hypothetical protein
MRPQPATVETDGELLRKEGARQARMALRARSTQRTDVPIRPRPIAWSLPAVDAARAALNGRLKSQREARGREAELAALLAAIQSLQTAIADGDSESDSETTLQLYLHAMFALVYHERWGGLAEARVKDLLQLASSLLQLAGAWGERSRLAPLAAELHLLKSQLLLKAGDYRGALWEHEVGAQVAGRRIPGGPERSALAFAIRSLRLGDAASASEHFAAAEAAGGRAYERARIGRIQSLRLAGDRAAADALARTACSGGSADFRRELDWEIVCIERSGGGDPRAMRACVARGASHYEASYVLEAALWDWASGDGSPRPGVATLKRRADLDFAAHRRLLAIAEAMESAHDAEIPFRLRLRTVGELLSDARLLRNVDKELLALAAAVRWLGRNRSRRLASVVRADYTALSLRLSAGGAPDVLGVLAADGG